MNKNSMYVVIETMDHDYNDLHTNFHSVCENACIAAMNAKSAYERFIKNMMLVNAPRFEDLHMQLSESETRWTYLEQDDVKNHYMKYSVYIKPYTPNTELSFCDTLRELEEMMF